MNDLKIINFLSHEKRATAREVADEMSISPADAVSALLRIEVQGKAQQLNGYWFIPAKPPKTEQKEDSE
jgi:predicted Rossmann fold nucleotide-binding protein DprA/Smf involved in DNA uptake